MNIENIFKFIKKEELIQLAVDLVNIPSQTGYILGEVALSFLGAGIQEPVASWGNMLQQAQSLRVLESFPWILAPGVFIFLTVLAFNFLGDGLRDALDPRRVEVRR